MNIGMRTSRVEKEIEEGEKKVKRRRQTRTDPRSLLTLPANGLSDRERTMD